MKNSDNKNIKRFYQIPEGKMIAGICNGLAAYFNVDVTIVRLIFVALAVFTQGGWIFVYLVMMIVAPTARTPEDLARARGESIATHYEEVKETKTEA